MLGSWNAGIRDAGLQFKKEWKVADGSLCVREGGNVCVSEYMCMCVSRYECVSECVYEHV